MGIFSNKVRASKTGELILGSAYSDLNSAMVAAYPGYPQQEFPTKAWLEYAKLLYSLTLHFGILQNPTSDKEFVKLVDKSLLDKLSEKKELTEGVALLNKKWFADAKSTYLDDTSVPSGEEYDDLQFYDMWAALLSSRLIDEFDLLSQDQKNIFQNTVHAQVVETTKGLAKHNFVAE